MPVKDRTDSIRLLAQELRNLNPRPAKPDWWSRASVISGFLSSVVITVIGLMITSSIQKAQLRSSERTAQAQIEAVHLKDESDERIQQSKLESDLLEHLSSKDRLQHALALNMLHRAVPADFYEQTVLIFAAQDPDPSVSAMAIQRLSRSTDPEVFRVISQIAHDTTKPQTVRYTATLASKSLAFTTSLSGTSQMGSDTANLDPKSLAFTNRSTGTIVMYATGLGQSAFETPVGSIFTHTILQGLDDDSLRKPEGGIDLRRLSEFIQTQVPVQAAPLGLHQQPFTTSEGSEVFGEPLLAPGSKTLAIVVGISKYHDPSLYSSRFPEVDAQKIAESLKRKGAQVTLLTGDEATEAGILAALASLRNAVDQNSDIVFYFGGIGWSQHDEAYFATVDSRASSSGGTPIGLEAKRLMSALSFLGGRRRIIFLDMCRTDITESK
jgi:hypothetical protein